MKKAAKKKAATTKKKRTTTRRTLGLAVAGFGYGYPLETRIEFFRAYGNASGVGCRISWGGFVFSFDVRGVVKHSLIKVPPSATPETRQIALELCTLAFLSLLVTSVDMAWREKNIRLHGVPR